jgi:hypothetical protein
MEEKGRSTDPLTRLRNASEKFDFLIMDPPSKPMEYAKQLTECKTEIETVITHNKYLKNAADPILDQVFQQLNKITEPLLKKLGERIDKLSGEIAKSGITPALHTQLAECKKEFNFLDKGRESTTRPTISAKEGNALVEQVQKQLESCNSLVRAGLKTDEPTMGNKSANNSREGSPRKPQ